MGWSKGILVISQAIEPTKGQTKIHMGFYFGRRNDIAAGYLYTFVLTFVAI